MRIVFRFRIINASVLAFWLFSCTTPTANAASKQMEEAIEGIANAVAAVLSKRMPTPSSPTIGLGVFSGPSQLSTAGPAIQNGLKDAFTRLGIKVRRQSSINLGGNYLAENDNDGLKLIIRATLTDALGKPLTQINSSEIRGFTVSEGILDATVNDERSAIMFLQPTVHIPSDMPPSDRGRLVSSSMMGAEGPPFLDGSVLFAKRSSPYGVEILVDGKARQPRIDEDGIAMVEIDRGEEYEVRLVNRSPFSAAAKLMIDGLGSFEFSEVVAKQGPRKGRPAYDHWILAPRSGSTNIVPGWHKRDQGKDNFLGFRVTSYADSAAGRLGHQSDLGTITTMFSAAWEAGQEPPRQLREPPRSRSLSDSTGFGKPKTQSVKPVQMEIGVVRSVVSLRYSRP